MTNAILLVIALLFICAFAWSYYKMSVLSNIANLNYSESLESNKALAIPSMSYVTLNYTLPYAGYLKISYSSTSAIYIWVGSNFSQQFPDGNYFSRYPPQRESSSGTFVVPVLPGEVYVTIYNPSIFNGVALTISIEYHY
ncbi:hypothetical protein IOK49_02590 [Fervidicoccus fontis]|uniref:Uncharacterized protein n=1 Tax=Fervidicoccus fontis TaxID=683846 RepID=A0A2J6N211_9CREN|nr:hypothetical protein [Fervidicoccus fontis]MBE9390967.1 hypothetical protein [Fervidicoccus fontis]PMB75381.1 MAG: hypothetical protein C0188_03470 [Fervidicoccus fontis]PMB76273.1 MAG: hypothetical protein C0177_07160 [Fervidicoccus fontis]HEW64247.1 hypothetical protein [Fervidicoccus fontis]